MADVTGLVIGVIALASLFTTCIDLFDRFELGRNYAYDYQLACTKLCLLKARLSAWGVSLNIEVPGHEHPRLRRHWTEEQEVIGRSLFGIREIFGNAQLLSEKYKLTPARPRIFRTAIASRPKEPCADSTAASTTQLSKSSWALLRKRTVWAIHDKQKFDSLIQDLAFLVDNLEKVVERLGMAVPNSGKVSGIESPPPSPPNRATIEPPHNLNAGGCSTTVPRLPGHFILPAHGVPPIQLPQPGSLEPLQFKELASSPGMTGHVAFANQDVNGAGFGALGNIGFAGPASRHIIVATQTVRGNGFGALGDVAADFALKLQEQQFRQQLALQRASNAPTEVQHGLDTVVSQVTTLDKSPTDRRPK